MPPPGEAKVQAVNRETGEVVPVITGLTGAIDVLCSKGPSGRRYITLELGGARLRVYEGSGFRTIAVPGTGMAEDPVSGDIFIARYYTGQISRVRVE